MNLLMPLFIILIAGVALAALVYSLFTLIVKLAGKENYLLTLSLTKRLFGDIWGKYFMIYSSQYFRY